MNNSLKRAARVANVMFSQGLSYFVHELNLKLHLPFFKKFAPKGKPPSDLPVRLRKVMEELGGAYLKLGQFLSIRPDLLPVEYCREFQKLLDKVPAMPFSKVKEVIEENLKAPSRTLFAHIEPKPIGSASIAQVHRARLTSGKNVAVKVQRPEAKAQFAADIQILYYLAHKIEKRFANKAISPLTIVKEFERYTAQELNFVLEARVIDRFAQHFKDSATVVVPKVYWPATTSQIITMDYLDGTKLTDTLKHAPAATRALLAKRIADTAFEQVLKLGLFHADLHPGNIFVLPGNRIGLLDFGIVGTLNDALIKQTVAIYTALVNKDSAAVTKVLLHVGVPEPDASIDDLKLDVERIVNEWYGTELGQARVSEMMRALFESAVSNGVALPISFLLLGKALVTMEGTCVALDPQFNFVAYSQPKIARLLREHRQPKAMLKRFTQTSRQYAELLSELPQQTSDVLERIKQGSIDLKINETDVKHIGMDLNRSSNRISYAMIIAALLVSAALLVDVPPKLGAYSFFTLAGITLAACLLFVLLVSVWREGMAPFDLHKEIRRQREP